MTTAGERLRHLETMEAVAQVGPQHIAHWSNATPIDAVAQTVIPGGAQDVTAMITVTYASQLIGVGTAGGTRTSGPGASTALYNVAGNTLSLTVGGGGDVTIARSAGVGSYNVSLMMVWI
jgi:hypothetical protein